MSGKIIKKESRRGFPWIMADRHLVNSAADDAGRIVLQPLFRVRIV